MNVAKAFETENKFISIRNHFVCWHVKCVEKGTFCKSGHTHNIIYVTISAKTCLVRTSMCFEKNEILKDW